MEWSSEWPKEPGYYWLAGYVWRDAEVKVYLVKVSKITNGLMHIANGNFLFESDVKDGAKWAKAVLPELPPM